jgi:hypothetical protein
LIPKGWEGVGGVSSGASLFRITEKMAGHEICSIVFGITGADEDSLFHNRRLLKRKVFN